MPGSRANPGRPPGPTPQQVEKVRKGARLGMSIPLLAGYAGIAQSTLYRWLSIGETAKDGSHRELWEALKEGEAFCAMGNLAVVHKAAQAGQWSAAAWLMERRFDYVKRQVVETGEENERRTKEDRMAALRERTRNTGLSEE